MSDRIPIILCIDVEPDQRLIDRNGGSTWKGYEQVYELTQKIRPRLEVATDTPVHFSWFYRLDPQIEEGYGRADFPLTKYEFYIESFQKNGDDIGIHPHYYKWSDIHKTWVQNRGDENWTHYCVQMCFEVFAKTLGKKSDSIRFGERWMSNSALALAEKMGARFDLTPEPGHQARGALVNDELFTGFLPDYIDTPQEPYRPSQTDFRKADSLRKDGIWIIPLSTGYVHYTFGRLETLYRKLITPNLLEPQCSTLNLSLYGPLNISKIINHALSLSEKPYLSAVIRSDAGIVPRERKNLEENLEFLIHHPLAERFRFSTAEETMKMLGFLENGSHGV